jgi:hypothetical protein
MESKMNNLPDYLLMDLCEKVYTPGKVEEDPYLGSECYTFSLSDPIELFKDLRESYEGVFKCISPILEGKKKINSNTLDGILEMIVYALEVPFERVPLLLNYDLSDRYKRTYNQYWGREVARRFKSVCSFRLALGR